MKASDLTIEMVQVEFFAETLSVPLQLSQGVITHTTYTEVTLQGRTRHGQSTTGIGAILLSDLWAFPTAQLNHPQKTALMRQVCLAIADWLRTVDGGDPLQIGFALEGVLPAIGQQVEAANTLPPGVSIPQLALLNCMAPFDAALHDGWGKAIGRPAYLCYTADWLNEDLSAYLGAAFAHRYPADYLGERRRTLLVQHVVGLSDPLTPAEIDPARRYPSALPIDLQSWIKRDRLFCFKLKLSGRSPQADVARLVAVADTASQTLREIGSTQGARFAVDPNEGYPDADALLEFVNRLQQDHPAIFAALAYIEQPTPRDLRGYTYTLHAASHRVPVIIDESLDRLENLPLLDKLGWSGLSLKTCKGHTHSLLAYCWGREEQLYLTIQDLTNPGRALVHSANLGAQMLLSSPTFECNSRQYLPLARPAEQAAFPMYFQVQDGVLQLPAESGAGIY